MKLQTVKSICEREYVPIDFGYKILKKLELNGITCSARGRNGGYRLAKAPEKISMLDVLLAIDTRLFINDDVEQSNQKGACRVSEEFGMLQNAWVKLLKEKTLDTFA